MYAFFVLGLIPGTNIQITFMMWSVAVLIIACSAIVWFYDIDVRVFMRNHSNRSPLHADQLHIRLSY